MCNAYKMEVHIKEAASELTKKETKGKTKEIEKITQGKFNI